MRDIMVSVVVPVYNAMKHLAEATDSICNQTLKDIEIIFVDDGSTDESYDYLMGLTKKDKRINVIKQKNSYAGVARNNGLKVAHGRYVVFWDADDVFELTALQEMYEQCEKDQADMCLCGADHYDESSGKYLMTQTYLKPGRTPAVTPFGHEEIDKYLFNFSTNVPWNKMFRRQFLLDYGIQYQKVPITDDVFFVMQAFFYANSFTYVNKVLVHYRVNYSGSQLSNASKSPLCIYDAFLATYDVLKKEEKFENVKQSFFNKTLRSFFYFLEKQSNMEAYKILYDKYKKDVFEKWGFPREKEYYYSQKDEDRLQNLFLLNAEEFLLSEYHREYNEMLMLRAENMELKMRIQGN